MTQNRFFLSLSVATLLLCLLPSRASLEGNPRFSDISGHWAEARINEVASWGIVSGNPDGTFQPDGLVSRAAFVKMIVGAAGLETRTTVRPTFSDTGDHWVFSQGYIEAAVEAGFVKVSEYGPLFDPDLPIPREEMAVMAVRAVGNAAEDMRPPLYADLDKATPFRREYIDAASRMELMNGYPGGIFGPKAPATRAEAVVVIGRVMGKIPGRLMAVSGKTGSPSPDEVPAVDPELLERREQAMLAAEKAFSKAVHVADGAGDWISTGNPGDNPGFFRLDCVDLRGVDLAMDADYLYVRFNLGGAIPAKGADCPLDGDTLTGLAYNISFDLDNNRTTGSRGNAGAEALFTCSFIVVQNTGKMRDSRYYSVGPTGLDQEDKAFQRRVDLEPNKDVRVWGGIESDYILTALPLSDVPVIPGQAISISVWAEAGSAKYHHATFDVLSSNPSGRDPAEAKSVVTLRP